MPPSAQNSRALQPCAECRCPVGAGAHQGRAAHGDVALTKLDIYCSEQSSLSRHALPGSFGHGRSVTAVTMWGAWEKEVLVGARNVRRNRKWGVAGADNVFPGRSRIVVAGCNVLLDRRIVVVTGDNV